MRKEALGSAVIGCEWLVVVGGGGRSDEAMGFRDRMVEPRVDVLESQRPVLSASRSK